MNLDIIFHKTTEKDNYARSQVLLRVYNRLLTYSGISIKVVHPSSLDIGSFNGSCASIDSLNNMTIVNPNNSKAVIFNISPRVYSSVLPNHGFDHLDVVQIIGGSSLSKVFYENAPKDIRLKLDTIRHPLTFPLDKITDEQTVLNFNIDNRSNKIKQAIFIGDTETLSGRKILTDILNKHPYFKVIHKLRDKDGIPFPKYLEEINKYKLTLSLNGQAEVCYRDWESMGIGLPVIRSELYSKYDGELIPDFHYIKGSESANNGIIDYKSSYQNIAEQFIDKIESIINEDDKLTEIGLNSRKYFEENLTVDKIVSNFFKVLDLNLLT